MRKNVTAVVLAAGRSHRMGRPKLLLPWGETTMLGQTLRNLQQSAVNDILLVTGHEAEALRAIATAHGVQAVHNPDYDRGEMLSSLQVGVRHLRKAVDAVLVMLADLPMVSSATIDQILAAYDEGCAELLAPAFGGRRGNPVLIGRPYFSELLALPWSEAPRVLLKQHKADLCLVEVETDAILHDLDRPEDYERYRPAGTRKTGE